VFISPSGFFETSSLGQREPQEKVLALANSYKAPLRFRGGWVCGVEPGGVSQKSPPQTCAQWVRGGWVGEAEPGGGIIKELHLNKAQFALTSEGK